MKKLVVLGAFSAALTSFAVFGASSASADDGVVGQKFSDAKATLSQEGKAVKVTSTVGDSKKWDDCIVTSAGASMAIDGFGGRRSSTVQVNLNCSADKKVAEE